MSKVIMIQGTMSNVGKSVVAAGICRVLKQDGYRVCPFKSQNMALNSFITKEGLEMGRAQVMQAEACGIEPSVLMNPILLKPNSDTGSQVIVNGEVIGNMDAKAYYADKKRFIPDIMKAYHALEKEYDIIVIEGAGSPAEINLKENDIVNMGMAELVDAPVLLVGDIDRGGVFAQLYGTVMLLKERERARIKGLIINKFRGDKSILEPGLAEIERLTRLPVVGVLPFTRLDIDDEDSLSGRLCTTGGEKPIDIAVIKLPRMSNFTDFAALESVEQVGVRYVENVNGLGRPDMLILPGTKSTIDDLLWMREKGFEAVLQRQAAEGTIVFGICGGYQMLGTKITDEAGVESGETGKSVRGIGLLPVTTVLAKEKRRTQVTGVLGKVGGGLEALSGIPFYGYEIHHGKTFYRDGAEAFAELSFSDSRCGGLDKRLLDGAWRGNVYGTYVHGIFDGEAVTEALVRTLLRKKGYCPETVQVRNREEYKEEQYDLLAQMLRENINPAALYEIVG